MPASTRGTTSLRIGSVPSARSALIWSVTTIDPSSAAMPDPTRPVSISAGQHRSELLDHRRADEPADDRPRAELIERQPALQRQHRAGEEAGQQHDRQRFDADGVELLDDVVPVDAAA